MLFRHGTARLAKQPMRSSSVLWPPGPSRGVVETLDDEARVGGIADGRRLVQLGLHLLFEHDQDGTASPAAGGRGPSSPWIGRRHDDPGLVSYDPGQVSRPSGVCRRLKDADGKM